MRPPKRFYRSNHDRMIAGVCGGIAEYFNLDPTLVRLGFVFFSLLPGPSIVYYIITWMIVPKAPRS